MQNLMYYWFEAGSILRQYSALFHLLVKLNNRVRRLDWPAYITKDTEMVMEGYFRSGNTFALRAFAISQPCDVCTANHTHAVATIKEAVKQKLPVLVLIRPPADTVISAVLKHPGTTLGQHLRWYSKYYQNVFALRSGVYIATFDEITSDFGRVICAINERFGTRFQPFEHTPENVKQVFAWIDAMDSRIYGSDISRFSLPLADKEAYKQDLRLKLQGNGMHVLLQRAEDLYHLIEVERG